VPTAIAYGSWDKTSHPKDSKWLVDQMSKNGNLVFEQMYEMAHGSFLMGNNMSYFNDDMLDLIHKYSKNIK